MATRSAASSGESGELKPRRAVPDKVVARLAHYRRILQAASDEAKRAIYSHEIAAIAHATAAQVRRDLMTVGFAGNPRHGYDVAGLLERLNTFLEVPRGVKLALVGIGNLGRAVLAYFSSGKAHISVEAAFDIEPSRVDRTINGCHCHHIDELPRVLATTKVDVAVITVPASEAQRVADTLIEAGVKSLINFSPVRLRVPKHVFVENVDLAIAIEKAAFFAKLT